jgi:hypothetical protein
MSNYQTISPVAFFIFNRPALTQRVFAAIRAAKPQRLLVIADGPRPRHLGDEKLCTQTRAVLEEIDWDCQIQTNFADTNLGCGRRIASGLDWVFAQVEQAICLEDDCLPDPSFFRYCDELLERYRKRKDVMMISGTNDLIEWQADRQSYHFSQHGSVWGWATWRRAWQHYDYGMGDWPSPASRARLAAILPDKARFDYRAKRCNSITLGTTDTWDYQWSYARLLAGGLCVTPAQNLVSNLGFGVDATHTTIARSTQANLPRHTLTFPLRPPNNMMADTTFDAALFQWQIYRPTVNLVQMRVQSLVHAGEKLRALQLLDVALSGTYWDSIDDIELSRLRLCRAEVLYALRRNAYALRELEDALALDPENCDAQQLLASMRVNP